MTIHVDYLDRVYAGVLGKLIGVYLGRPFENWSYDKIMAELGEINYYVHEKLNRPLVITDDDLSGTFTFLRALSDYPHGRSLTPAQIGVTWMNYIIEEQTILWWGGMGVSTEHTAYLRMKHGSRPPHSGSAALNGKTVSEQIGAQIFIDGWGMISPGDPELAAEFARKAACVSHDGEAIYGAQVVAAIEAQAFVEPDINKLLDVAVRFIPKDSLIYRLIADMRNWRAGIADWRIAREKIVVNYGYDKYGGGCHMLPNHALIHLGLLYGEDNFQKSLMITNTSGWDTDCNSGNVGCIMGIKNGIAGIDSDADWRGPIADRLFLPTADGGRCITDAVQESVRIVNIGRQLRGLDPILPKGGARYHFETPGSVQGFDSHSPGLLLENTPGYSLQGTRCLALRFQDLAPGNFLRAATATFIQPSDSAISNVPGYKLYASPTLYSGQIIRTRLSADLANRVPVQVGIFLQIYGVSDQSKQVPGPIMTLNPGEAQVMEWTVPASGSQPIHTIGLELGAAQNATGIVYLDYLTWDGTPDITLASPEQPSTMWQQAWVRAVDRFWVHGPEKIHLVQNEGRGLAIQGAREWQAYCLAADITPVMCTSGGIAACVQGMRRYYALLLAPGGKLRLIKCLGEELCLAEMDFPWVFEQLYHLALEIDGDRVRASVDGRFFFDVLDVEAPLHMGAIALLVDEGHISINQVLVHPLAKSPKLR